MGCQCVISWGVSLCDGGQSGVSRCEFGQVSLDVAQGKWTFGVMGVSVCSVDVLGGQCVLSWWWGSVCAQLVCWGLLVWLGITVLRGQSECD